LKEKKMQPTMPTNQHNQSVNQPTSITTTNGKKRENVIEKS